MAPIQSDKVINEVCGLADYANRLLFHARESQMISANFKKNVKQLQVQMTDGNEGNEDYMDYDDNTKERSYHGEAFPNLDVVNHAVGFLNNGKLILIPVRDVYDMQHSVVSGKSNETGNKIDESHLPNPKKEMSGPVRVKFGRTENDFAKKRRENSSMHKQKLIDDDPWIELEIERIRLAKLYNNCVENNSGAAIKLEAADIKH